MSEIWFHTTLKGNLPHLYYIFHKPGMIGPEFKTIACYLTIALILLEIQREKERIKSHRYHLELGATADCTKRLMYYMKGLVHRYLKGSTRVCFLFYNWFSPNKAAVTAASISVDLIGMVKKQQRILQGYDRWVDEGLAWQILHSVDEQAYGARGKATTWYWLQVKLP